VRPAADPGPVVDVGPGLQRRRHPLGVEPGADLADAVPGGVRSKISRTIAASVGSTSSRRSRAPSRAFAGFGCGSSVSVNL
jgi:hypothetical protein